MLGCATESNVLNDIRHALRSLRKHPGFTAAVVLTLAIGLGATTTIFSAVNAVLLRPLPAHDPGGLVSVAERRADGRERSSLSLPEYEAYRDHVGGAVELAAHHASDVTLTTPAGAEVALGLDVSGNYFSVLGLTPAAGRFFDEAEARGPGAAPVAVLSYDAWQVRFDGDPGAVGRTLRVNGQALTIVGVAPRGFHGTMLGARPPVWLPIGLYDQLHPGRDAYTWGSMTWLQLFGRLAPGTTAQQAEAALAVRARQHGASHEYDDNPPVGARVREFTTIPVGLQNAVTGFMILLLATAGLVLLIAMVNVTGMLLVRAAARRREVAVRLAIGAPRRILVRQLAVESVTLALVGGAAGVLLATWLTAFLATVRPPFAGMFVLDLSLDWRVMTFAASAAVVAGIACGLAPALAVTRGGAPSVLREGARGPDGRSRLRSTLVASQIALSAVLLVSAGLFVRTLQSALRTDHGLDPRGVFVAEIDLRLAGYDEGSGRAFYDRLVERVRAVSGTEAAALAEVVPLGPSWEQTRVMVPGHEPPPGEAGHLIYYNVVSPEYFETVRLPLVSGRALTAADRDGPPVMVVNETFARRFWPDGSAVGQHVRRGRQDGVEIVGVVPDGRYRAFSEPPTLYAYVPFGQEYAHGMSLHVRTRADAETFAAALRAEIRALDPDVAPIMIASLTEVLESSLFPQRLAAGLIGGLGVLGLVLAVVGVFGALSFRVVQRQREIGVRVALGASGLRVIGLVVRDALGLFGVGLVGGLVAAGLVARLFMGLLHGLSPVDPATYVAVAALLGVSVTVAAYLPARRAASVDPMEALRSE
jgi:predicted permease